MNRLLHALLVSVCAAVCATLLTAAPASAADIDEWRDLSGQRGVVVLMRHALAPGGGDPAGFRLGDCRTQRNLSREGRQQARAIGAAIERSAIDIDAVLSSPWCRSKDTANLLGLGPVRTVRYLGSTFTAPQSVSDARESRTRRLIRSHQGEDSVLILVGHYANIMDLTGEAVDSGESLIVRMNPRGDIEVLGRIPAPTISSRPGS
jgi:phosphohistidine phosphatase SixA